MYKSRKINGSDRQKVEVNKVTENFFRYIAFGYLLKNYSDKFIKITKYHLVKKSMTEHDCVAVFETQGGEGFQLLINVPKREIHHSGCYMKNRNYPNADLINEALTRFNKN